MTLFKTWSEDKLNKKFVVAKKFVCLEGRALLTNVYGIRKYEK